MRFPEIESAKRQPLNVIVYEELKKAIVNGDIEPGTRMTETLVSKQLNVSSTPVREAFRRLSSEGLIKILPWKGAIVQEFSSKKILDVYQCRANLEELAVELSIPNFDEKGIVQLKELLRESMTVETHTEYVEINTQLHDLILHYANNETLNQLIGQIKDVVIHNRIISAYSEQRKNEINNEHQKLIHYIEQKDTVNAKKAINEHIINGYEYIKDRFK